MQEKWIWSLYREDLLEKEMATHSKILAWDKRTEEPAAAAAESLQSCPTLCDPIDGSPPGSPIPGILQARTLEWVAISFSNAWKWKVKVKSLSRVRPSATPTMGSQKSWTWLNNSTTTMWIKVRDFKASAMQHLQALEELGVCLSSFYLLIL